MTTTTCKCCGKEASDEICSVCWATRRLPQTFSLERDVLDAFGPSARRWYVFARGNWFERPTPSPATEEPERP